MIIGHSTAGVAIEAERFGPPATDEVALVFGAIHGDEAESAELCRRLAERLRARPPARPVVIVPVVNPDGLAALQKNNGRDVDLNRNFPARNWVSAHAAGYHPGQRPRSEPETAALCGLIDRLRPSLFIALHQPFRCVNWDGPAEALARRMSDACGYPARASVGYPTPGSFGSLYGVDRALPVITLELPRQVTQADYDGCLRALELVVK